MHILILISILCYGLFPIKIYATNIVVSSIFIPTLEKKRKIITHTNHAHRSPYPSKNASQYHDTSITPSFSVLLNSSSVLLRHKKKLPPRTLKSTLHTLIKPLDSSQFLGKPTRYPDHILKPGTWTANLLFSGSYINHSDIDLVFANIQQLKRRSFHIQSNIGTFVKEGILIGNTISVTRSNLLLTGNIMQNFVKRYVQEGNLDVTFAPFIRNYVPLTNKHTLYLVNQTELAYTYAISAYETPINREGGLSLPIPGIVQNTQLTLERKFKTIQKIGLRLVPGFVVFFTPRFAIETYVGIFELLYKTEEIKYQYDKNNLPSQQNTKVNRNNQSFDVDFSINILKLGLGFAYYL